MTSWYFWNVAIKSLTCQYLKTWERLHNFCVSSIEEYGLSVDLLCFFRPGCSMLEIWDVEDPSNAANPPLCSILLKDPRPYFTTVFQNTMYRVLKVNWDPATPTTLQCTAAPGAGRRVGGRERDLTFWLIFTSNNHTFYKGCLERRNI